MREITFRAWLNWHTRMVKWEDLHLEKDEDGIFLWVGTSGEDDFELMQYTGLKDNNGTEIYEGDILKIESNFSLRKDTVVQKVSYDNEGYYVTGEFALFELSQSRKYGEQSFEVIGNIYEHKHLLEGM